MKPEAETEAGILRRAAELVTRNWGLKLLSLTLAVVIYHTLKPAGGRTTVAADVRFTTSTVK